MTIRSAKFTVSEPNQLWLSGITEHVAWRD